jgi:hypothetical protein
MDEFSGLHANVGAPPAARTGEGSEFMPLADIIEREKESIKSTCRSARRT